MSRIFRTGISFGAALLVAGALSGSALADETSTNTNVQTGSNDASSVQTVAAISGDAMATDDGSATSGDAIAAVAAFQGQFIVQVAANQVVVGDAFPTADGDVVIENDNSASQDATHSSSNDQTGAAISGEAVADAESDATSGDAVAAGQAVIEQATIQVSVNQALVSIDGLLGGLE